MSFSMYQISVPVFQQMLTNLDYVLQQGAAFAKEKGLDEADLMERRLAPDMFTFGQQIVRACEHSAGATARLAGIAPPDLPPEPDDGILRAEGVDVGKIDYLGAILKDKFQGQR